MTETNRFKEVEEILKWGSGSVWYQTLTGNLRRILTQNTSTLTMSDYSEVATNLLCLIDNLNELNNSDISPDTEVIENIGKVSRIIAALSKRNRPLASLCKTASTALEAYMDSKPISEPTLRVKDEDLEDYLDFSNAMLSDIAREIQVELNTKKCLNNGRASTMSTEELRQIQRQTLQDNLNKSIDLLFMERSVNRFKKETE